MTPFERILEEARTLSERDREILATALYSTLEDVGPFVPQWRDDLIRRLRGIEDGNDKLVAAAEEIAARHPSPAA
jgi:hypothetical protein